MNAQPSSRHFALGVEALLALLLLASAGMGAWQRGRFCTNTGFRDILLIRDSTPFRAWALAVAVQMVGVTTLSSLELLPTTVPPFWWPANILGGVLFGMGIVLAGGCSSGTCYRNEYTQSLDVRGEICPYPLFEAKGAIEKLAAGDTFEVLIDYPLALDNITRWAENAGHSVLQLDKLGASEWRIVLQRGG